MYSPDRPESPQTREFIDPLYAQNSRVLHRPTAGDCWLIDPGLPPSAANMLKYVSENKLTPVAVILTHAHADHIAGIPEVLEAFPGLAVHLAECEWGFLSDPAANLSSMSGLDLRMEVPNLVALEEGGVLSLGDLVWEVFDTCGHSPGGRTLYNARHHLAVVGDALFAGGIGRVDFPHSDGPRLLNNIRTKLLTLPEQTRVLSGHGPETTIGAERRTNPFVGQHAGQIQF